MDVEGLLAEVERAAQLRMIERCRERKARRDPNGNFQYFRRHNCKARRRHRKAMAKRTAEAAQRIEWRAPTGMQVMNAQKLKDCAEGLGAII